jgi:hypothetical protein
MFFRPQKQHVGYRKMPMTTEEIIARALCAADGWEPDGFNPNAPNHKQWELWVKRQAIFLAALSSAGYEIVPGEATSAMIEAHQGECAGDADEAGPQSIRKAWAAMIQAAVEAK